MVEDREDYDAVFSLMDVMSELGLCIDYDGVCIGDLLMEYWK